MTDPAVLLDARWLGLGGAGRVTELVLQGLRENPPPGHWTVWGGARVRKLLWEGVEHWEDGAHPGAWFGQRRVLGRYHRSFDHAVFLHQVRPLRRMARNESTMIYDTIPFRYPSMPKAALLMRTYMKLVAHRTDAILTCSHYSRQCIERDLGVDSKKVTVVPLGIDPQSMQRVSSHRAVRDASDFILYVGADQPHKNLDRLIEGFLDTGFARVGGRLVIVGVGTRGVSRLSRWEHEARIRVESYVDQPVLEDLLATTRLLVQPSMEEGFGLPVAEAIAARIPIIASSGGSLPEITQGRIPLFDPFSSGAIAAAIDEALSRSNELIQPLDIAWPSPGDLARELIQSIGLKA